MAAGTAITTLIAAFAQAIVAVFAYLLARHNTKNDTKTKRQENIDQAKDKVDDACHNGNLSDLLDATKDLGNKKKE